MSNVSGEEFDKVNGIEHDSNAALPYAIWFKDNKIVDVAQTIEDNIQLFGKWEGDSEVSIMPCRGADPLMVMLVLQDKMAKRLGTEYNSQYTMNHILYTEAEMHEFLREIEGFKAWKTYDWDEEERQKHLDNAKEEFVDMLHFLWNVANSIGFTADEITARFVSKNIINHKRQDLSY